MSESEKCELYDEQLPRRIGTSPSAQLPLPGNDVQPHQHQRERLIGHVHRVQGGELQDQEGEEDALAPSR